MLQLRNNTGSPSVDLNKPRISVGRDERNDLVLHDGSVSGFHAELFFENGRVEVVDLGSSNGTLLNGRPVKGRESVKAWDSLQFGKAILEVVDTESRRPTHVMPPLAGQPGQRPAPQPAAGQEVLAVLVSQTSAPVPARFEVRGTVTIGRTSGNDLVLDAGTISSRHAQILASGGSLEIVDLGSTNGTWVNGQRIQRQRLRHGDRARFDEIEYLVQAPSSASRTQVNPGAGFQPGQTVVNPKLEDASRKTPPSVPAAGTPGKKTAAFGQDGPGHGANRPRPASPSPRTIVDPAPPHQQPFGNGYPGHGPHGPEYSTATRGGLGWLLFSLEGRLPRMPYFLTGLAFCIIPLIILIYFAFFSIGLHGLSGNAHFGFGASSAFMMLILWLVLGLFTLWCFIACTVKRLHDFDANGAWFLLSFIPFVNIIAQFFWLLIRGTPGPNRYGYPPERIL